MPQPTIRRWAAGALALAALGTGVALLFHPLTALELVVGAVAVGLAVAGVHEVLTSPTMRDRLVGVALVAAGIAAGLAPVWTTRVLVVVLAAVLLAEGAVRLRPPRRAGRVVTGLSLVLLGALCLLWPDLSLFAIAYLAGVRLVLLAGRAGAYAAGVVEHPVRPPRRWGPSMRRVGLVSALAATTVASALTVHAVVTTPRPDAFYDPPTRAAPPGELLRAERFDRHVPAGARAWRILYRTTDVAGRATTASALVTVPLGSRPHPVIAWAHGTTGFARPCAPSLRDHALGAGGAASYAAAVSRGWAVVATDYPGMGTPGVQPYLIGPGEAHAVLDAVRAARQLSSVDLADQTVVWGHSQGGHAALWTGIEQPTYAPDVPLSGVAAAAPVSNPASFLRDLQKRPVGTVFVAYALAAYDGTYGDVAIADHVRAVAQAPMREIADRCLRARSTSVSVNEARLMADRFVTRPLFTGNLGRRLRENAATGRIEVPVLIAQGSADRVVPRRLQDRFVAGRCGEGQPLDYRVYRGEDHRDIVLPGSPFVGDLTDWTADRLAGSPATPTCDDPG